MEKNEAQKGNTEHVFGDLQFSFKPAGCHLKNYNNVSKVVFLSIPPSRENFGYREDSLLILIFY